ncbi:kinase-like domain-containing protein [Dichomitus squalens]|uniref:Kinase-like domain-containing protein n=2 Tax=Dichomitus squalens TaxID=114155 RepID=A0A4Q9Q5Q8_9APHY|nr:kinase-like domain-containing protein [Dichomitus squalens]
MANAVASSSRDRPSQTRASMPSLSQHDSPQGVVMTHEIKHGRRTGLEGLKMINQYLLMIKVGKGQHGDVYLAEDTLALDEKNKKVAVKVVRRKNKSDRLKKLRRNDNLPRYPHLPLADQLGSTEHKIRKEIAIMKKLSHPHVVRLLEVIDDPLTDKIYMVMEYLGGGEIKWRTANDNPLLRVDQTRRICRDVILGLEYLHYQGIIHRDIKPANLLWTADRRTVKISDFGVSTFSYAQRLAAAGKGNFKEDDTDPILMDDSDLSKTAGTPMFLAPEIVADASESAYHLPLPHAHSQSSTQTQTQAQTPTQQQQQRKKPPITKAIDIWAFGVTLYGLLFGTLPFHAQTEFEIYKVIRTQDWDVPETMGLDRVPTGGRYPALRQGAAAYERAKGKRPVGKLVATAADPEGVQVMGLLEGLLEKNAAKRITLEQVKRHPWILRDLANPEEWLRETQLTKYIPLEPTYDETSSAMSAVRFRWARLGTRIWSTIRNVRPQRSFRRARPRDSGDRERDRDRREEDEVGVRSAPHYVHVARLDRDREREPAERAVSGPRQLASGSVREKRRRSRQEISRNKSTNDIQTRPGGGGTTSNMNNGKAPAGSFEPWAMWNSSSPGAGPSKSKSTETGLKIPSQSSRVTSPLPSPIAGPSSSVGTTSVGDYQHLPGERSPDSERPRSLVMSWMRKLGGSSSNSSHRQSSYSAYSSPMTESTVNLSQHRFSSHHPSPHHHQYQYPGVAATSPPSRDSAEAHATSRQSSVSMGMGGHLTKAMRAASWTAPDFAAHARPSEDMTSLYSGDRPDDVDDEAFLYGAGGVAGSPVPSVPNSALLSTVSSVHSIGPPSMSAAHAFLQRAEGASAEPAEASGSQDPVPSTPRTAPSAAARHRTTSPLAKVTYHACGDESPGSGSDSEDEGEDDDAAFSYDSADDSSSGFQPPRGRTGRTRDVLAPMHMLVNEDVGDVDTGSSTYEHQPSMAQLYADEDEESEDEDAVPLEVRTRRPSRSAAEMSPPRRPLSAHRATPQEGKQRPMICT